jgi:hypothetical protein
MSECARRERLVDRDVDAADPGPVHANVTHKIATAVHHGDIHWLSDFRRFGFRRRDDLPSFSQLP